MKTKYDEPISKEEQQLTREKIVCFLMNYFLDIKSSNKNPSKLLLDEMLKFFPNEKEVPSLQSITSILKKAQSHHSNNANAFVNSKKRLNK